MVHQKHFTLTQAIALLPEIITKLKRIVELKSSLDAQGYNIYSHYYFGGISSNGTGEYPPELGDLIKNVDEITKAGILIKEIDSGLIDFPHVRKNGEEVYLCFHLGEDTINYWHKMNEGYPGRRSIDEL